MPQLDGKRQRVARRRGSGSPRCLGNAVVAASALLTATLAISELAAPASAAVTAAGATAAQAWHSSAVTAPSGAAKDPEAQLEGISCPRAKDCVAGGFYHNRAGAFLPMVVTESDGRWARATRLELPANAAKNPGGAVDAVACWAVGSCIAVGDYSTREKLLGLGFVATESKGSWSRATVLALPANAALDPVAIFYGATCTGPASCVAVGSYQNSAVDFLSVVVTESRGVWQPAQEITLPSNASLGLGDQLTGVACRSAGSCVAVGSYSVHSGGSRGMEVVESDGTWHQGTQMRAPAGTRPRLGNTLTGVSCSANSCTAVGGYSTATGDRALAVTYASGRWGRAITLPAPAGGGGPHALVQLSSVACTRTGCTAVGSYFGGGHGGVPIAAAESAGRWTRPVPVALPAGHGTGAEAQAVLNAVACAPRACTAVGFFLHKGPSLRGMVSTQR